MAGSTFIQVPQNVEDPQQLRRFLDKLVQQLDVAFGNRGDDAFITSGGFLTSVSSLQELISAINDELLDYSKVDGSRNFTDKVSYDKDLSFTGGSNELASIKYIESNYTNNPLQPTIDDLNQTISDPPTKAEVQAISDKIDTILSSLRDSNIII